MRIAELFFIFILFLKIEKLFFVFKIKIKKFLISRSD